MNKERLLAVADAIEADPKHFNMRYPHKPRPECGTAGCIAGYTKLFGPQTIYEAGEYLGLNQTQRYQLFFCGAIWSRYHKELGIMVCPSGLGCDYESVQPHHAVMMLRNLASGKWSF